VYTDPVINAWTAVINGATQEQLPGVVQNVIAQMDSLGQKDGFDQSQILSIRKLAVDRGTDGRFFQDLLEKTKMDNISLV
jgi:hypothetical protein